MKKKPTRHQKKQPSIAHDKNSYGLRNFREWYKKTNPLIWTLITALCMPFLVFTCAVFQTSDTHPLESQIECWQAGKQMICDNGTGLTLSVSDQSSYIFYRIPKYQQNASAFFCDISLQKPIRPQISLYYRRQDPTSAKKKGFRWVNMSPYIRSIANNTIHVPFDDYPRLIDANELVLSFTSPHGKNLITLNHPRLKSYAFASRFKQAFNALLRRQPLTQGSNNFILSQKINGHGYLYFLKISALLATGLLLFRRFIIRDRFSIIIHIAITIVIMTTLSDMRNSKDYFQNALAAFKLRSGSNSLAEHLGKHEIRYRWFGDVVKAIQKELPNGGYYLTNIKDPQSGLLQAVKRAYYYVRPALHTNDASKATLAVLYHTTIEDVDRSFEWQLKTVTPSGVHVYVKKP